MSEYPNEKLSTLGAALTVEQLREMTSAATPHFAQQLRGRVARLIADLPQGHPTRIFGEQEIQRLTSLGGSGSLTGQQASSDPR